jgi:predicted Ser/Thr protein kinase
MSALQSLGKYQLVAELGHGGFASVYKAHDPDLGLDVALKVLEPNLMRDRAFVERFRTEARVAARLRHPNIARVLNIDQAEGRLFIAIEYVPGRNLRDWLSTQPLLDWTDVSSIMQQVAEALDYAHAQGVLHRDVKPSNILISDSGTAVLSDFGLAKAVEASHITTAGATVGTYAYMAPEQASGTDVDARADLYSLGVVAYELCTGRVPFTSDSTPALIHDQVYALPPVPSQVNPRVTTPIDTILLKALAKDPEQRYQSGLEFAAALKTAIAQATGEHLTVLYQEAVTLQQQGDLAAADAKLQELLAVQPGHAEAQAMLTEIRRQRESQERYRQLAQELMALRAEAANLHQSDPQLPDPDGVLAALLDSPSLSAADSTATSMPTDTPQTESLLRGIGVILVILGVIVFGIGISIANSILIVTEDLSKLRELNEGNFMIGLGLGVAVTSAVLLVISTRRPKASTWRT